jgi:hypothetical protein
VDGSAFQDCIPGADHCGPGINHSGRLLVAALINGQRLEAEARVFAGILDSVPPNGDVPPDSASVPPDTVGCATCVYPFPNQRASLDSIVRNMDTTQTYCRETRDSLSALLQANRVFVTPSNYGGTGLNRVIWLGATTKATLTQPIWMRLWNGLWLKPGTVLEWEDAHYFAYLFKITPHLLEDTFVHEGLHVIGRTHPGGQGGTFPPGLVAACMNPASR